MELKEKIITGAYELFAEKGFNKTTVSEIIDRAGASKGGFYHHFKSKDDVLKAISMRYIEDIQTYYDELVRDEARPAIDLINDVIVKINQYKAEQSVEWSKITKIFSFSGSHIVIKNLADQFERVTTELYAKLIFKGINQGIFQVCYPEVLAGLWTREIMTVYRKARKVIYSKKPSGMQGLNDLLDFSENLLNSTVGLENNKIQIKKAVLEYMDYLKEQFRNKEENNG